MCTLVLAWQVFTETPIVAAANRDESYDREFRPPSLLEDDPRIIAPQDQKAGGTWIGYNEHGVFAAITNRWVDADLAGERSRGLLVRDVLGYETAESATRHVESELDAREYAGFNLVIADDSAALYVEWDGSPRVRNLEPGVHVVVNVGIDGDYQIPGFRQDAAERQATSADQLRTVLQLEPGEGSVEWLERAAEAIRDHDYGVCVHGEGFGTTSSSLITIGDGVSYRFANGPPCEIAYRDVETGCTGGRKPC